MVAAASPVTVGSDQGPEVTMTGDVGEITLFFSGRQRVSQVRLDGPDQLVDRLRTAHFRL